jgi:hypothetical protein
VSTGFLSEPGSREPGLDQLISALTADGYPHELAGRDTALATFRAARSEPRRRVRSRVWECSAARLARVRAGGSARLGAVAAAVVAALAALTVAAYAQALPAPMQHIAYQVLSPFGVPNSKVAPADHPRASTEAARHPVSDRHRSTRRSAKAACPCQGPAARSAMKGSTLTITAARTLFPANGWDAFAGTLTNQGQPERDVRLVLLEQTTGGSGWVRAGSGVTGPRGRIRIGIPHLTQNATFELSGAHEVVSSAVSVTVIPHVSIWRAAAKPGTNRLVASSRFGDVGDVVTLEKLSGGSWQSVASEPLNAAHRVSFALPAATSAGHYYRAMLLATGSHGASVSQQIFEPRSGAGAHTIPPRTIEIRSSPPARHATHHKKRPVTPGTGTPTPDPVVSGPRVPKPTSTGPADPSPGPSPISPSPTAGSPVGPGADLM